MVEFALRIISRLMMSVIVVPVIFAVVPMLPARVMGLPAKVKALAAFAVPLFWKTMPVKDGFPAVRLLVVLFWTLPTKISGAPVDGRVFKSQLVELFQNPEPPPPSQVLPAIVSEAVVVMKATTMKYRAFFIMFVVFFIN
jgi:hypothetical protein